MPKCLKCQIGFFKKQKNPFLFKIGLRHMKSCLRVFAKNTGADHPVHPRSLISTFVFSVLESIICKLATGEISIFQIVSVAEETGLKLSLSETPKTGFLATRPNCYTGV